MANLIPTMGYYACDVKLRIKNPRLGGVFVFGGIFPCVKSQGAIWAPITFSIQAEAGCRRQAFKCFRGVSTE